MLTTHFGRKLETWEYSHLNFCERGGILPDSWMGKAIFCLSENELRQLSAVVDPAEDNLIYVGCNGFIVNHGNVGNTGIRYNFY